MKQTDGWDWIIYTIIVTAVSLWILFMVYVPLKLNTIVKLLSSKATTVLTTSTEKGDIENLVNDWRSIR